MVTDSNNLELIKQVIQTINKAVFEQSKNYNNFDVRIILCIMRNLPKTSMEVVLLIEEFSTYQSKKIIVGVDVAGDELN